MYSIDTFVQNAKKAGEWLLKEYSQIHTGRASPTVLDGVSAEAYGVLQPLKNISSITIEDPKTLRVIPWDKTLVKPIEKALQSADIGLSVATDDSGIRVIFPALTTENRTKLVKILKEKLEDARITIRKEREEAISQMESDSLPEDQEFRMKEDLQKKVGEANANLEAIFEKKEAEVMN